MSKTALRNKKFWKNKREKTKANKAKKVEMGKKVEITDCLISIVVKSELDDSVKTCESELKHVKTHGVDIELLKGRSFIFRNGICVNPGDVEMCVKCDKHASLKCQLAHDYTFYMCKYDKFGCKRSDCKFFHEKRKVLVKECIFGDKCKALKNGLECKFKHSTKVSKPKVECKFGTNCRSLLDSSKVCTFSHETVQTLPAN